MLQKPRWRTKTLVFFQNRTKIVLGLLWCEKMSWTNRSRTKLLVDFWLWCWGQQTTNYLFAFSGGPKPPTGGPPTPSGDPKPPTVDPPTPSGDPKPPTVQPPPGTTEAAKTTKAPQTSQEPSSSPAPKQFETCGVAQPKKILTRIFGGLKVSPGAVPWQVSLQQKPKNSNMKYSHVCGGVLIESCWVLTAGHCV